MSGGNTKGQSVSWFKMDDGFPDHPSMVDMTADDGWQWVCMIAYASKYRTDGFVPRMQAYRCSTVSDAGGTLARLVELGRLTVDAERDGYWVVNYLDHQRSRTEIEADQERNRERVKRYRKQKSEKVAGNGDVTALHPESGGNALQGGDVTAYIAPCTGDVTHPDTDTDTDTSLVKSVSDLRELSTGVDDDQATAAANTIAQRRLARSQQPIGNPNAWLAAVRLDVIAECIALADQGITAAEIADRIEPEPAPALTTDPTATERAEYRQRINCDHCHGTGMRETDAGYVSCDHTGSTDSAPRPRLTLVETPTGT